VQNFLQKLTETKNGGRGASQDRRVRRRGHGEQESEKRHGVEPAKARHRRQDSYGEDGARDAPGPERRRRRVEKPEETGYHSKYER
jgi:hypothetical protein